MGNNLKDMEWNCLPGVLEAGPVEYSREQIKPSMVRGSQLSQLKYG